MGTRPRGLRATGCHFTVKVLIAKLVIPKHNRANFHHWVKIMWYQVFFRSWPPHHCCHTFFRMKTTGGAPTTGFSSSLSFPWRRRKSGGAAHNQLNKIVSDITNAKSSNIRGTNLKFDLEPLAKITRKRQNAKPTTKTMHKDLMQTMSMSLCNGNSALDVLTYSELAETTCCLWRRKRMLRLGTTPCNLETRIPFFWKRNNFWDNGLLRYIVGHHVTT